MSKENSKASLREEYESLQAERRERFLENLLKEAILNVLAEQQQTPKPPPSDPNDPANAALPPVPPPAAPASPTPAATPPAPPAPPTDPAAAAAPPPPPPAPAMPGVGEPAAPAAPGAQPGAKEASVTALVDSLNVIRGGKSLTDPEVMGGISTVFKSLTSEQKQELTNVLEMLSKAVAGTEEQAPETQGVPAPVMTPPPPPAPPAPAASPPPISPTGI